MAKKQKSPEEEEEEEEEERRRTYSKVRHSLRLVKNIKTPKKKLTPSRFSKCGP